MNQFETEIVPISVCMTVFNGIKFLEIQISSILREIRPFDELIIVDDGSTDGSREYLSSLSDSRIKLHFNEGNLGVLGSFEFAIQKSSGEYIFLSDQDDEWLPGRVSEAIKLHRQYRSPLIVVNAALMNEFHEVFIKSYFSHRNSAPGIVHNFFKNTYLGCCMSFSASLKEFILPFPKFIPMHDEWIGLSSEFYGKPFFCSTVFVRYRRHSTNQTSLNRSSLSKVAAKRVKWLRMLMLQWSRCRK